MKHRRAPRLTAAFVVTIASGCGGSGPTSNPPDRGLPTTTIERNADGTCTEVLHANPPGSRKIDCPVDGTAKVAGDGEGDDEDPTGRKIGPAPEGWRVEKKEDGRCVAYGPDPCQHEGCNPPPPRLVICPANLKQTTD